jgi:hypothetical protein
LHVSVGRPDRGLVPGGWPMNDDLRVAEGDVIDEDQFEDE